MSHAGPLSPDRGKFGLVRIRLGEVTKVTLFLIKLFYVFFPWQVAGVINEQQ
jgi:hypothetical protein